MAEQNAYRPDDQAEKLGAPPWKPTDPALIAWEQAHGHDPRLSCHSVILCGVMEAIAESEHEELVALRDEVRRLPFWQVRTTTGEELSVLVKEALLANTDFPAIAALLRSEGTHHEGKG